MYEKAALDNFTGVSGMGSIINNHKLNEGGLVSYFHIFILGTQSVAVASLSIHKIPDMERAQMALVRHLLLKLKQELKTQTCHWRKFQGLA